MSPLSISVWQHVQLSEQIPSPDNPGRFLRRQAANKQTNLQQSLDVHLTQAAVTETEVVDTLVQVKQQLVQTVPQVARGQVHPSQARQTPESLVQLVQGVDVEIDVHGVGQAEGSQGGQEEEGLQQRIPAAQVLADVWVLDLQVWDVLKREDYVRRWQVYWCSADVQKPDYVVFAMT